MTMIVVQEWEESERGWGTSWDGYSLHLSTADREDFIREYWDSLPDAVPNVYSRPYGDPVLFDIEFDRELIQRIENTENGLRTWERVLGE